MEKGSVRVAFVGRLKNALLYEFLRRKEWSQTDLARELDVRLPTVNSWMLLKAAPKNEALLKKVEMLLGRLREDIFPEFFQSDESRKIRMKLPKEHAVIREVPVRMLVRSGSISIPSPEVEYDEKELHDCMERTLSSLSPKEADILRDRFGLHDGDPRTLDEISNRLGISRERARQIERRAVRKLRLIGGKGGLDSFLE